MRLKARNVRLSGGFQLGEHGVKLEWKGNFTTGRRGTNGRTGRDHGQVRSVLRNKRVPHLGIKKWVGRRCREFERSADLWCSCCIVLVQVFLLHSPCYGSLVFAQEEADPVANEG